MTLFPLERSEFALNPKYVAIRPRTLNQSAPSAYGDSLYEAEMSITVHEQQVEPIHTGLLDAQGVPLYRIQERHPLGFQPHRWKA